MEPIDLVKRWYETRDRALLNPAIEWHVLEHWPAGGTYRSAQAVFDDFFPKLLAQFTSYEAVPEAYFPSAQTVLVSGYYTGVGQATGRSFRSAFVHIWAVNDNQLASFRQVADTAAVQAILPSP